MKYTVVSYKYPSEFLTFVEKVNEMLKKGWKLRGGIAVNNHYYYQAMVAESSEEASSLAEEEASSSEKNEEA